MITYRKLYKTLNNKNMKKTDLLKVISSTSLAKLGKDESITIETVNKICGFLQCQPNDIMEYVNSDGSIPYANKIEEITIKGYENVEKTPQEEINKMKKAAENDDTEKLGKLMLDAIMKASGLKDYIEEQLGEKKIDNKE